MASGGEKTDQPIVVDLFSGIGGFSLGFEAAGGDVAVAVDNNSISLQLHKKNFPGTRHICRDLGEDPPTSPSDVELEGSPEILIGGPPCQGFSAMGKRDPEDPRNELVISFAAAVEGLRPNYFVMENVPGFLAEEDHQKYSEFMDRISDAGYSLVRPVQKLDASDYGVPQNRERVFLIGHDDSEPAPSYPTPGYPIFGLDAPPTSWDALGDLAPLTNGAKDNSSEVSIDAPDRENDYLKAVENELGTAQPQRSNDTLGGMVPSDHQSSTVKRFSKTAPGEYEPVSRYFRLEKDGLSPTLRAGTGPSKGSYMAARPIHPVQDRCITVRESARLHSFPDSFQFHETKWHSLMGIGNSVPPLLAKAVAGNLLKPTG